MDLESIRTKPEEKNKYMILLTCGILKKNDTNKFIYKTEKDSQT